MIHFFSLKCNYVETYGGIFCFLKLLFKKELKKRKHEKKTILKEL